MINIVIVMENRNYKKTTTFSLLAMMSSVLGQTNTLKIFHNICSTYVSYDLFFNPLVLCTSGHILDDLPFIPPVAYVLNGWPISQTKNK